MIEQVLVDTSVLAGMLAMLSERMSQYEAKCEELCDKCEDAVNKYNHMLNACENGTVSDDLSHISPDKLEDCFLESAARVSDARIELAKCVGAQECLEEMLSSLKAYTAEYAQR